MPNFLESKLKAEYGNNPHAIYGTMNKLGAMHGNKVTAKGKAMERKHARDYGKKMSVGKLMASRKAPAKVADDDEDGE